VLALALAPQSGRAQQLVWQSDLQVKALTVSESGGHLVATVSLVAGLGEATAARVEVLLPVGVGILHLGPGCAPGPSPPGVPSLRARVICSAGNLRPGDLRAFTVTTTMPPGGMERRFGVMAMSDTPDPRPGNNFAERVIPGPP
jgi:hypothetical protein